MKDLAVSVVVVQLGSFTRSRGRPQLCLMDDDGMIDNQGGDARHAQRATRNASSDCNYGSNARVFMTVCTPQTN